MDAFVRGITADNEFDRALERLCAPPPPSPPQAVSERKRAREEPEDEVSPVETHLPLTEFNRAVKLEQDGWEAAMVSRRRELVAAVDALEGHLGRIEIEGPLVAAAGRAVQDYRDRLEHERDQLERDILNLEGDVGHLEIDVEELEELRDHLAIEVQQLEQRRDGNRLLIDGHARTIGDLEADRLRLQQYHHQLTIDGPPEEVLAEANLALMALMDETWTKIKAWETTLEDLKSSCLARHGTNQVLEAQRVKLESLLRDLRVDGTYRSEVETCRNVLNDVYQRAEATGSPFSKRMCYFM